MESPYRQGYPQGPVTNSSKSNVWLRVVLALGAVLTLMIVFAVIAVFSLLALASGMEDGPEWNDDAASGNRHVPTRAKRLRP